MKLTRDLLTKLTLTTILWACSFILVPIFIFLATPTQWIVALVLYYFLADWMVSATLHHAHSHKDWEPPRWWTVIMLWWGAALGQGTPLTWSAWHRYHHRTSDTPNDPHSPRYDSFFWVVFCIYWHKYDLRAASDWIKDRHVVWVTKYQPEIAVLTFALLYWILPFGWFLAIWAVPLALSNVGPSIGHAIIGHWDCVWKDRGEKEPTIDSLWIFPFAFSGYKHRTHHLKMGMPAGRLAISTRVIRWLAPHRIKKEVE